MGNYQFCFTCTKWCICFFTLSFSEAKEATHFAIIVMALVVNPFHFQNGTSSKESAYYLFLRMPSCTLHPPAFSTGGCHRSKLPLMQMCFLLLLSKDIVPQCGNIYISISAAESVCVYLNVQNIQKMLLMWVTYNFRFQHTSNS